MIKQTGLLNIQNPPVENRLGVNDLIEREPICDGDLTPFIPTYEKQHGVYFDTMACVSFGGCDSIETIMMCMYGIRANYSDRFIAKTSGTTHKGNWYTKVADAIMEHGMVDEEDWDYPRDQRTPPYLWDDYYSDITPEVLAKGLMWKAKYKVTARLVPINTVDIKEQLKYGPIKIGYWTRSKMVDGIYQRDPAYHDATHCVMIYNVDDNGIIEVLDHYERDGKGHIKFAADYQFGYWALQYYVDLRNNDKVMLKENHLYQLVEGLGGFGLCIDGHLFIDDTAKLLASQLVRTNGDIQGKFGTLTQEQWDSVEHYNLKRDKIN